MSATAIFTGMATFAEKLRYVRERAGRRQSEVASYLKVHQSRISKWEDGEGTPDLERVFTLANYFGVPLAYFCDPEATDPEDVASVEEEFLKTQPRSLQTCWEVIRRIGPEAALDLLLGKSVAKEKGKADGPEGPKELARPTRTAKPLGGADRTDYGLPNHKTPHAKKN